ncbi:hypothetical protein KAU19_04370 [Candidatus Parcubacteria bacterium]|nr:hypothetical protein [Candidatus Parcubacteria bacterium]
MIRLLEGVFFNKKKNILFLNIGDDVIYYQYKSNSFVCTGSRKCGKNVKISDELYNKYIANKLYEARRKLSKLNISA